VVGLAQTVARLTPSFDRQFHDARLVGVGMAGVQAEEFVVVLAPAPVFARVLVSTVDRQEAGDHLYDVHVGHLFD